METKEQFNQLQAMMEQLVTLVGHNNAVTEELVGRMDRLEVRLGTLETQTAGGFADVVQMITLLGQKVDKMEAAQLLHTEMLRKLTADYAQHEAEILLLKRAR